MTKSHRCCVLSRPWIKFQLRNLGFDHVAAGVPNGSWEHFNHRRLLHWTQISRQHCSRTKPCLTTIQLDSRHDYHAILSGSMVPHACNLLTRPGIQLMLLLVEMCLKKKTVKRKQAQDPAQSDMFPVPLGQLLVPQPLRWSRWKGDCTQLWKSQLSGLSQNKALQNIMFVWSAFSLGNGNLISVSQCPVFGTTHFDLPRSGPQWFLLFGPWMKQVPVHSWIWSQEAPFYSWGSSHLYQEQETQI